MQYSPYLDPAHTRIRLYSFARRLSDLPTTPATATALLALPVSVQGLVYAFAGGDTEEILSALERAVRGGSVD